MWFFVFLFFLRLGGERLFIAVIRPIMSSKWLKRGKCCSLINKKVNGGNLRQSQYLCFLLDYTGSALITPSSCFIPYLQCGHKCTVYTEAMCNASCGHGLYYSRFISWNMCILKRVRDPYEWVDILGVHPEGFEFLYRKYFCYKSYKRLPFSASRLVGKNSIIQRLGTKSVGAGRNATNYIGQNVEKRWISVIPLLMQ